MMKQVLITGATGIVGSRLAPRLGPDTNCIPFNEDIRDASAIDRVLLETEHIDSIIHLAAIVPKQIVDLDLRAAFDVNVGGTLNLLGSLRKRQKLGLSSPWMYFASTSHVYASSQTPLNESSLRQPFTGYGLTKLQAEEWCEAYARDFGIPMCIGRLFSFSAPEQSHHYFIPAMIKRIRQAKPGEALEIPGTAGLREFMRVSQVCSAISFLEAKKIIGTLNIGTGRPRVLIELVREVAKRLGRDDLKIMSADDQPTSLVCDPSLLRKAGFELSDETDLLIREMADSRIDR